MNAGVVIYGLLYSDATTTGLVGNRIFPDVAPQRSARPNIVYTEISSVANNTLESASSMDISRIQVTICAETRALAEQIGAAVRARMDYQRNVTYNGVTALWVIYQSSVGYFDQISDQDGLYMLNQDYKISVQQ